MEGVSYKRDARDVNRYDSLVKLGGSGADVRFIGARGRGFGKGSWALFRASQPQRRGLA